MTRSKKMLYFFFGVRLKFVTDASVGNSMEVSHVLVEAGTSTHISGKTI